MNEDWQEKLLFALDGKYRELREDNHVTANEVLVYDVATGTVEAVDLMELPLRYPCGPGHRWSYGDLGELVADKAMLYRQSCVAHEISDDDPSSQPPCGTVVLMITEDYRPYHWVTVKARILPDG